MADEVFSAVWAISSKVSADPPADARMTGSRRMDFSRVHEGF
jgi:hypothetical protein